MEGVGREVSDTDSRSHPTRRGLLRTAVAGTTTGAITSSSANAQQQTTIDMTDSLVFDPDSTTVAPGTTVVWENVGSVPHSVTAYGDEIPEEATYFASGGFESEDAADSAYPEGAIDGGGTYEHTFEVEGEYGYFCIPHEGADMVASLTVAAGAGGGGAGDGGPPAVPGSALSLVIGILGAMGTVLGLAYFFLKYGGRPEDAE